MINDSDDATTPDRPDVVPGQSPGALLRGKREAAGISHAEASEALHLTIHYIKALENDDYGKLPALTFVKGYLRSYAAYLKTDVNEVMAGFERLSVNFVEERPQPPPPRRTLPRNGQVLPWALAAAAVLLILVIGIAWWLISRGGDEIADAGISRNAALSTQALVMGATEQPIAAARPVNPVAANRRIAANGAASMPTNGMGRLAASNTVSGIESVRNLVLAEDVINGAEEIDAVDTVDVADVPVVVEEAVEETKASVPAIVEEAVEETEVLGTPVPTSAVPVPAAAPEVVVADQGTSVPTRANVISGSAAAIVAALTRDEVPEVDVANGARQVRLMGAGDDLLHLQFTGSSWVEIDDASRVRLYHDMLNAGDAITVKGSSPFYLLLGDARNVEVILNSRKVNVVRDIQPDRSARVVVSNESRTSRGVAN